MTFNKKPQFPLTYGDHVENDDVRLSNYVVALMKSKKFQNYTTALFFALLTLGSYAQPSSAIPPEYGEAAANAAQDFEQWVPPVGNEQVAGAVNPNPEAINPIPGIRTEGGAAANQNIQPLGGHQQNLPPQQGPRIQTNQKKPLQYSFMTPPQTVVGQRLNTVGVTAAVTLICLNGVWGNPVFAWGCAGILFRLAIAVEERFRP